MGGVRINDPCFRCKSDDVSAKDVRSPIITNSSIRLILNLHPLSFYTYLYSIPLFRFVLNLCKTYYNLIK